MVKAKKRKGKHPNDDMSPADWGNRPNLGMVQDEINRLYASVLESQRTMSLPMITLPGVDPTPGSMTILTPDGPPPTESTDEELFEAINHIDRILQGLRS